MMPELNPLVIAVSRRVPVEFLERIITSGWVPRIHDSVEPLRERLAEFLSGASAAILAPYDRVDADVLRECTKLRIIANASAGFDNLDLAACSMRGIMCTNAPDGVTQSTADFAIGMLIAAARRILEADALVRGEGWGPSTYETFMSAEIGGSTLGILGMGRIGQAIARRAAHGFGMRVLYSSRSRLPTALEKELHCVYVDKAKLLNQSDHVMVALPYSAETRHAIGARDFAAMRKGAIFVHVGRGGVVDDRALAEALTSGRLGGAALDVFEDEPRFAQELLHAPRLVLSPHIASATRSGRMATLHQALENVAAGLERKVPPNLLNRDALTCSEESMRG